MNTFCRRSSCARYRISTHSQSARSSLLSADWYVYVLSFFPALLWFALFCPICECWCKRSSIIVSNFCGAHWNRCVMHKPQGKDQMFNRSMWSEETQSKSQNLNINHEKAKTKIGNVSEQLKFVLNRHDRLHEHTHLRQNRAIFFCIHQTQKSADRF